MSKKYQAHISAYGSLIVIGLEASKYSETRYNEVISTLCLVFVASLFYYIDSLVTAWCRKQSGDATEQAARTVEDAAEQDELPDLFTGNPVSLREEEW